MNHIAGPRGTAVLAPGSSPEAGPQCRDLRGQGRRPPRQNWDPGDPRRSLWQLTTRPPRASTDGWGSGSQLPVENGVFVRTGGADGGWEMPDL
jgi:hypothetical protein